jgi:hypothetical protein
VVQFITTFILDFSRFYWQWRCCFFDIEVFRFIVDAFFFHLNSDIKCKNVQHKIKMTVLKTHIGLCVTVEISSRGKYCYPRRKSRVTDFFYEGWYFFLFISLPRTNSLLGHCFRRYFIFFMKKYCYLCNSATFIVTWYTWINSDNNLHLPMVNYHYKQ